MPNQPYPCRVCGNMLPPYMRICDRCGSIQRPVAGDGEPIPEDEWGACQRCGIPIPAGDVLCAECAAIESIEIKREPKKGNAGETVAALFLGIGLSATGFLVWGMITSEAIAGFAIGLIFSVSTILIPGIYLLLSRRMPTEIIERYPKIPPPGQAVREGASTSASEPKAGQ
ncbi:MAG: hypothetical protein PHO53_03435 [Actinomycetota bacterium]|nr:hypothetical protein [Actinomycetota bacterium]